MDAAAGHGWCVTTTFNNGDAVQHKRRLCWTLIVWHNINVCRFRDAWVLHSSQLGLQTQALYYLNNVTNINSFLCQTILTDCQINHSDRLVWSILWTACWTCTNAARSIKVICCQCIQAFSTVYTALYQHTVYSTASQKAKAAQSTVPTAAHTSHQRSEQEPAWLRRGIPRFSKSTQMTDTLTLILIFPDSHILTYITIDLLIYKHQLLPTQTLQIYRHQWYTAFSNDIPASQYQHQPNWYPQNFRPAAFLIMPQTFQISKQSL